MAGSMQSIQHLVVSGNVLYNETDGGHSALSISIIGSSKTWAPCNKVSRGGPYRPPGTTADDLSIGEYANSIGPIVLARQSATTGSRSGAQGQQVCLERRGGPTARRMTAPMEDCAPSRLVSRPESCESRVMLRCRIASGTTLLFSESPSRIIASFGESAGKQSRNRRLKGVHDLKSAAPTDKDACNTRQLRRAAENAL